MLVLVPVRCSELAEPIAQFAPRQAVQGCNVQESMATCVNLTNSGFEPSLLGQKAKTFTARPFGQ